MAAVLQRLLAGALPVPFLLAAAAAPAGADAQVVFSFTDPAIVESSGLVVVDGLFVTTNDSGDTGRVFTVDPATGDTVGVTTWAESPVDVEALAPAGDGTVWVGDIGDNPGERATVRVARVPVGRGDREAAGAPTYDLDLPEGPQDAETLLVEPRTGRLVVVTKSIFGGTVLEAPERLQAGVGNDLRPVGGVLPVATDGAFFPDGRHVVLRDYERAVVYTWPGLDRLGEVDLPEQEQGEGIAVDARGRVHISSEGVRSPVLRVDLPAEITRAMAAGPSPGATPSGPAGAAPNGGLGNDLVAVDEAQRPEWPWFLGGFLALGALLVLVRSLRPR